jgi:hypothetical protein
MIARLEDWSREEALPLDGVLRRHLLQGVLRRWSRSRHADALVLRGGLMTQRWVGPRRRATSDIDFLGLFPRDLGDMQGRLEEMLSVTGEDDEVSFDLATLRGGIIWQETDHPGLRFLLSCAVAERGMELQVDVGFGDPLVPPAEWIDYPTLVGPPARVRAVRPELLVAWKLNGLFDHGPKRWQAKDLHDLHLLATHCQLEAETLAEAIRVAFEAHSDPLDSIPGVVYSPGWWATEAARNRWAKFRAQSVVPVPEDLVGVAAAVARALRPALARLIELPS